MSSNFTVTRDEVISMALRKLGVLEIGETPDAATVTNASLSLNLLVKSMSTEGLKLWKNSEIIIPLVTGQTTYILGGVSSTLMYDSLAPLTAITDKPLKAIQGFYRNYLLSPYIDVPVMLLSKDEYNVLGSKYTTGIANSAFYDPKTTFGVLSVYLTPDAYASVNLKLHVVCQMPLNDLNVAGDVPDFPNEWMNCLVWNLADQLALEYGVPMNHRQEIGQRAMMYREAMTSFDVEPNSTYFTPDFRVGR